jgi:hypothetical protein
MDDEGPSFEDELGMMDEIQAEFIEGEEGEARDSQEHRWARPGIPEDGYNNSVSPSQHDTFEGEIPLWYTSCADRNRWLSNGWTLILYLEAL